MKSRKNSTPKEPVVQPVIIAKQKKALSKLQPTSSSAFATAASLWSSLPYRRVIE